MEIDKSMTKVFSIESINEMIDDGVLLYNYPLQREADQWSLLMKSNLVSDILQNNPIPALIFAEEIRNDAPLIWNIDGKQRSTTCYGFAHDAFKISKNVTRYLIKYYAQIYDENGKPVLDKEGYPTTEYCEFDIRGKKFSQFPKSLQKKFLKYIFTCEKYLNCTPDEIRYHIARLNSGKAMSKSQKGMTHLTESLGMVVKRISSLPFFRERGNYKISEEKNGTLDRIVIESVMATKYLNHWCKPSEEMCDYLAENAKREDFIRFENLLERLDKVLTDETEEMFDSKNSFLWFSLFARFANTGIEDEKFIEFMAEFAKSLHSKKIDGVCFDELCVDETGKLRSTKDKYIVIPKMELLIKLMCEYLGITENDIKEKEEDIITEEEDKLKENEVLEEVAETVEDEVVEEDKKENKDDVSDDELIELLDNIDRDTENELSAIDEEEADEEGYNLISKSIDDIDVDFNSLLAELNGEELVTFDDDDDDISDEVKNEEMKEKIAALDFIKKNVMENVTVSDVQDYENFLIDTVRVSSPLYNACKKALLAMIAYVYDKEEDKEFADWISQYQNTRVEFSPNQEEEFKIIKNDFENDMKIKAVAS